MRDGGAEATMLKIALVYDEMAERAAKQEKLTGPRSN
jgi:hypothetical protein